MRSVRRLVAVLLIAAAPLVVVGCKQGLGDRCQVNSDCDDNLLCILPANGTPQSGGTCQAPGGGDSGVPLDFATTQDARQTD
jgi:hypothetical protein